MTTIESKPIFMVSSPRAGSTLFRLVMDAHPNVAVPPPAWLYDFIWPFLYSYGDLSARDNLKALAQDMIDTPTLQRWDSRPSAEELCDRTPETSFRGLYDALHKWYGDQYGGKPRWGEKSPRYAFWVDEILADYPGALFIHLIRDGRDVALDISAATFYPETVLAAAQMWKNQVNSIRESAKRVPDGQYLEVKYEAFCADPEMYLRKICDFVGEDFAPQMLTHYDTPQTKQWAGSDGIHAQTAQPITTKYCEFYKRDMPAYDRAVIAGEVGDLLRELGYPVDEEPITLDPRLQNQMEASDKNTMLQNAIFKYELRNRRKERFDAGVWDDGDRPSKLWSCV